MPPRRLEVAREPELQISLRLRELVGGHRVADRAQLLQELDQRRVRLCRHDFRAGDERASRAAQSEAGSRTVRVAVRLAQILIESARERAAEDRVHHLRAGSSRSSMRGTPTPPIRNDDCAAPGLSTSTTVVRLRRWRRARRRRRHGPRAPMPPNSARARRSTSSGRTSPTTSSVALFGRIVRRVEALHLVARDATRPTPRSRPADGRMDAARRRRAARTRGRRSPAPRSRSCCSAVSRTLRTRSRSARGKSGCSATSANSASALSSCAVGAWSDTVLCSHPLLALSCTPRYAA